MLGRSSLLVGAAHVSQRRLFACPSILTRRFSYTNQNKPETKEAANEALADAQAGKTAAEVKHHKATTGGAPLARESGAAGAKATLDNAVSSQAPHDTAHSLWLTHTPLAHSSACCCPVCVQTSSSQPVNRSDAGPDVLREKGKKSNKPDISN